MRLPSFAALALTVLLPLSAAAATVTVRSGETLSDIAARYDVSVDSLMRLNGIRDPDHVEIGSRLKVPGQAATAGPGRHRVSEGETLGEIAARYQVSSRDLIALNDLRHADHVELGETLKLPANAVLPVTKPKQEPIKVVPGASQHIVGQGQTLSQIARAYNLPMTSLVSFNQLDNPDQVMVGMRLYLKAPQTTVQTTKPKTSEPQTAVQPQTSAQSSPADKPTAKAKPATGVPVTTAAKPAVQKPVSIQKKAKTSQPVEAVIAKQADWRTYGPLQVDWANWRPMGGSQVVPSLNDKGQALYLAVNCSAGKINATGADGSWKAWAAPANRFEKDLVKDRCQAKA